MDRWLTRVARHRAQYARRFVTPEQIVEVAGQQGALAWALLALDPNDLARQFRVGVQAGSSSERYRRVKVQEAMQTLVLAGQVNSNRAAKQQPPAFDELAIAMDVLKARNVRNPARFLLPQPPPTPMPGMPGMGPMGLMGLAAGPGPGGVPQGPQPGPLLPQPGPGPALPVEAGRPAMPGPGAMQLGGGVG